MWSFCFTQHKEYEQGVYCSLPKLTMLIERKTEEMREQVNNTSAKLLSAIKYTPILFPHQYISGEKSGVKSITTVYFSGRNMSSFSSLFLFLPTVSQREWQSLVSPSLQADLTCPIFSRSVLLSLSLLAHFLLSPYPSQLNERTNIFTLFYTC